MDISGDLLALTLVRATIEDDLDGLGEVLDQIERTPQVDQMLRCLCGALATTLELNMGRERALAQVEFWRQSMIAQAN